MLLTISSAYADSDHFSLSVAIGNRVSSFQNDISDDVMAMGPMLTSSFGYKFTDWEFLAHSQIKIGITENFNQKAEGSIIKGRTVYRGMGFGPMIKYHFNDILFLKVPIINQDIEIWPFYVKFGPTYQILTTNKWDKRTVSGGKHNPNNIIKYRGGGFTLGAGMSNNPPDFKNQIFMEMLYTFITYERLTVTEDAGRDTKVVHKEKLRYDFYERTFALIVGMVLF
jgi:hypothetical protein